MFPPVVAALSWEFETVASDSELEHLVHAGRTASEGTHADTHRQYKTRETGIMNAAVIRFDGIEYFSRVNR